MYFINPLFLYALFAIAIPIAVHLFNFQRFKIFYFSDTRFIKNLKQRTQRQSQLKKLIILSLRIIAIIAIVFAFARPYIPLEKNKGQSKGIYHIVLYVDNSFSMEGISRRGTLLDEAKEKAKSISQAYSEEDRFMLITNDFSAKHQQFFSKEEIKKEIDAIQISAVSRPLDLVMNYALLHLSRQQTANQKVYIISDFQQSMSNFANIPKDENTYTYLIPLKANTINNVYLDTAWFETPIFQVEQANTLRLILKNSSKNEVEKLPVKLFVNNKQKAVASADIKANGTTEVKMNFTVFEKGLQHAHIEILDYPINFDDKLYFTFYIDDTYSVLSIYGEKENTFLNALFQNDSSINYHTINEHNIDYATLKNQDLIILDQVKEQSSGFISAIEDYVRQGGNLLIIPSVNKDIAMSNILNQRLNISRFESLDSQKTRFAALNLEHDIYNHIFEKIDANMDYPNVFYYYVLSKGIFHNKQTLIRLENNHDFLCVYPIEKGNVYLLATPLDNAYSEFQKHALFVPTIYNMAILANIQEKPYYTIGENFRIPLNKIEIQADNIIEITHPTTNFSFIPEIRNQMSGLSIFVHDQIKEANNYLIKEKENIIGGLSFNYNRKESEMVFYNKSNLEEHIKDNELTNYTVLNLQNKSTNAIISEIETTGTRLWQYFILLALAALLSEVLLLRLWKP